MATALDHSPPSAGALAELAALLARATGEGAGWAAAIRPESLVEGDLGLDSLELADLSELLCSRYGPAADLLPWLAGLDLEQIIGLTVADVSAYLDSMVKTETDAELGRGGEDRT